jgi:hypothetical protein
MEPARDASGFRRLGRTGSGVNRRRMMLGLIAAVLVVLWLLGFLAFHVAGGLIHILLVLAVIMIVLHFIRGRA